MRTPPPDIVHAAQLAEQARKIPASISLAQWAQESAWGARMPPGSNNPFGIKALHGEPAVVAETHEFVAGRFVSIRAGFRAFDSIAQAFDAHAQLLATSPHYWGARLLLPDVDGFCRALTGVYATDPHYGDELVTLIREEGFAKYDAPTGGAHAP